MAMGNALGATYTQTFLVDALDRSDCDGVLMILKGVARSVVGTYDMSFEDPASDARSTSLGLVKNAFRFADQDF